MLNGKETGSQKEKCRLTEGNAGKCPLRQWHFDGQEVTGYRKEEEVGGM